MRYYWYSLCHSVCWSYHIKSPLWWLLWNGCAWTSRNAGASILDETCNTRILRSENIAVNCPGDSLFTWGVLQIGVPIKKNNIINPRFAWGDKGWFWGTLGLRHTIWDDWDSMIWCKVWGSYGRLEATSAICDYVGPQLWNTPKHIEASYISIYPLVNVYYSRTMERSTIFNGKIHYFNGHFQ